MTLEQQSEKLCADLDASIAIALARKAAVGKDSLATETAGRLFAVPARRTRTLPASCYYQGDEFPRVAPPALRMRDESRPPTPTERDARAIRERGRDGLLRFFRGRYSRRLGRVVRPS